MKNLLVTIVAAFMAVVGYAQTTFNVRIGGGFFQREYHRYYSLNEIRTDVGAALTFESNIPLGAKTNRTVFSPSLFVVSDFRDGTNLDIPLHFGYKVSLGYGSLFIPKIGPMVGYHGCDDDYDGNGFAFGPSTELAFEFNHFVIAANGYYDINHECVGAFCTVGYKF